MPFRVRSAIVAALVLLTAVGPALASTGTGGAAKAPGAVRLAGSLITDLGSMTSTGHLDPGRVLQVGVMVANPNRAAADAAARAMYTPGSASFHKFLTPAEYA